MTLRPKGPIRVLIVDDSAAVRLAMTEVLSADPGIVVIGTAADPFAAARRMREDVPDVITLDVEMPRMDGITFLRKIMEQHPIPVVVCSSLVGDQSETMLQALEAGAVEIVCKPQMGVGQFLHDSHERLCMAVKAAASARIRRGRPVVAPQAKLTADAVLPPLSRNAPLAKTTERIIAVGASTGGTEALRAFLCEMPEDCPAIVVVQHMPENFTAAFARRLDGLARISVREAKNGDRLLRGQALIAPGNSHAVVVRSGAHYRVEVRDGPLVSRHRPSVDVLFRSVARAAGRNAVGLIMTGMGDDGARGLKEMRDAGARTLGQDEQSCVVYGMPKEAMRLGGVEEELPLDRLALAALRLASGA
jgi:two-component system, chemotaxis family, protein-glutamate methylesterase/glutaminase